MFFVIYFVMYIPFKYPESFFNLSFICCFHCDFFFFFLKIAPHFIIFLSSWFLSPLRIDPQTGHIIPPFSGHLDQKIQNTEYL